MRHFLIWIALMSMITAPAAAGDSSVGRITGFGGIFFKADDPEAISRWYREVLGIDMEKWGGALLRYDAKEHPSYIVWSPFKEDTTYFDPSTREFMLNFAVDDLDAFLTHLKALGVTILGRNDHDPNGKFAWIMDPEGTKIELWQPIKG